MKHRVGVFHGVNFDVLERRDPEVYGGFSLPDLEVRIQRFARDLGIDVSFTQTNHEGEFCEALHKTSESLDGLVVNAGAWTHYSYAIRDALELTGVPAVEVHLSAVSERDDFRRTSVIRELCIGQVEGKGVDGYREALELLRGRFEA
jgi:3-dehydroquinate dehydratase II